MKMMNLYEKGERKVRPYTILYENNSISFLFFVVPDRECWLAGNRMNGDLI